MQVKSVRLEAHEGPRSELQHVVVVQEKVLQPQSLECVLVDVRQFVFAQIQPLQIYKVAESSDFDFLDSTVADVEMLQTAERTQVGSLKDPAPEVVPVQIQLLSFGWQHVWNDVKSFLGAVHVLIDGVAKAFFGATLNSSFGRSKGGREDKEQKEQRKV